MTTIWAMLSVSIAQLKLEELTNSLTYLGYTVWILEQILNKILQVFLSFSGSTP